MPVRPVFPAVDRRETQIVLDIQTFSNKSGGFSFFKAAGHPGVAATARQLFGGLESAAQVIVYDPQGFATAFAQLHDLSRLAISHVLVQNIDEIGQKVLGQTTRPVTDLPGLTDGSGADGVLLCMAFDSDRILDHMRHLIPADMKIVTLDEMRLDADRLTNPRHYLDPLNFATNFAFFRDIEADGENLHTTIFTANYWHGYGAKGLKLWAILVDETGTQIAEWTQSLPDAAAPIEIDSRAVRERFGLGDFTGQLFLHVSGVRGHDIVKYALDIHGGSHAGSAARLSCTHDANAWPSDLFAGLPAPGEGEQVLLWIQNSHPCEIPAGAIGLNLMGDEAIVWLDRAVPPFGTLALDVADLLPEAAWPRQIEIQAGKHVVRPRYEVIYSGGGVGRRRIAHVNVERDDLSHDPRIAEIGNLMGKSFILPAPILPPDRFKSIALPTPMATCQKRLPLALLVYDPAGKEVGRKRFGTLARDRSVAFDLDDLISADTFSSNGHAGYGHMELVYDFDGGGDNNQADGIDGWLHALFRYEDRVTGHIAETSFGAHIFNTVLVYKNEPQSYAAGPPGLSTRLFLRLANGVFEEDGIDTMCHLIYAASTPWHDHSATSLTLHGGDGSEIATRDINIACGGSRLWRCSEIFSHDERKAAASENGAAYVLIRDSSCRLFGYHGLVAQDDAGFSFDHMFGF